MNLLFIVGNWYKTENQNLSRVTYFINDQYKVRTEKKQINRSNVRLAKQVTEKSLLFPKK